MCTATTRVRNERLQDQAGALVDLLHADTTYPPGSVILEAGCGVRAQTDQPRRAEPGGAIYLVGCLRRFAC